MAFTTEQKKQVDRLPVSYFKAPEGSEMTDADYKTMATAKLEKLSPAQLKARVNITGVMGSSNRVVNYSAENNYTKAEQGAITRALKVGGKWIDQVVEAVTGPDVEQRLAKLEAK